MEILNEFCEIDRPRSDTIRLTIGRTDVTTVLNSFTVDCLLQALDRLSRDPEMKLLVLSAAGDRTFIAGADLREMISFDQNAAERFIAQLRDLCNAVRDFPVPVVARIAGWCLGGGLELAMACDLRVASSAARFAMPEVRVGVPSVIHAALLPRIVGWGRARWLILTGATLDAPTALSWGLVDVVAAPDALDTELEKSVEPILDCDPGVIRQQKTLLRAWEDLPLSDAIDSSIAVFGRAFLTDQPRRHMTAALARRRTRNVR
jgi:enoyl-CoA hydratase/carnithine racemase